MRRIHHPARRARWVAGAFGTVGYVSIASVVAVQTGADATESETDNAETPAGLEVDNAPLDLEGSALPPDSDDGPENQDTDTSDEIVSTTTTAAPTTTSSDSGGPPSSAGPTTVVVDTTAPLTTVAPTTTAAPTTTVAPTTTSGAS